MTQPSGWYDDPQDPTNLRYFDGILWTDNVVPRAAPPAGSAPLGGPFDPYAAAPAAPAAPGGAGAAPGAHNSYVDANPYPNLGQVPYGAPPAYDYRAAPHAGWHVSGPTTPEGTPLAAWWQRLLASLLDGLFTGVVSLLVTMPFWLPAAQAYGRLLGDLFNSTTGDIDSRAIQAVTDQLVAAMVPVTLIQLVLVVAYQVVFLTRSGATPGKMMLGIRVRRTRRPGPLTVVEALRREALRVGFAVLGLVPLISLVASLLNLLDPMWLLWDPRRQTLHDKVADTLVEVKAQPLR